MKRREEKRKEATKVIVIVGAWEQASNREISCIRGSGSIQFAHDPARCTDDGDTFSLTDLSPVWTLLLKAVSVSVPILLVLIVVVVVVLVLVACLIILVSSVKL